jgi:hypothetical protein
MKYDPEADVYYVEIPYLAGEYEQSMIALKPDAECLACQCGEGAELPHFGGACGAVWSALLRHTVDEERWHTYRRFRPS